MKEPSDFPPQFRRQIRPGTRLNGIYEIDALIATGGMGEVYSGRAIETGIKVAIKMVRSDLTENETVLALFRKEAAALHNLQHEAVVRYYVFTTDPELQCPYLAMEFVEGQSLSTLVAQGPLPLASVRILQRRIGSALAAAHRAGIVHRDISPDNIILPEGDASRAKLIDFGIARSAFGGGTVIGDRFAGKANYASPEQVGLYGGVTGPKADIYSFGLTLTAAILGEPLNMGGTQLEVVRKRQVLPPDLRRVDPSFRPLLAKMLQPKPDDRPASMAEVAAWEPEPTRIGALDRGRPGRRWVVPAIAGTALLVSAGAGFFVSRYLDEDAPLAPAPARMAHQGEPAPAPEARRAGPPDRAAEPARAAPEPAPSLALLPPPPAAPPPAAAARQTPSDPALQLPSALPAVPQPVIPPAEPAAPRQEPVRPPPQEASAPPAPARPALPPGVFQDCSFCPQLVAVPGGRFRMGSNADPTERPVRDVTIRGFAAGRFPVTVAEWRDCVLDKACAFDPGGNPDEPVRNVSWADAQAYIAWLSRLSGMRYRLLTEAEWEYAARAGTTTRYWWGDQFRSDMSPCRSCGTPASRAPPKVGSFPANPFGLHGVTGSVTQWTQDCWHKDYRGAPKDGSAWLGPQCRERVLRGGAWNNDEAGLRVSSREFYEASVRYPNHGFRVARDM
ncbi:SUMF1/EgtB/PvdO family nonheme iron enzyme [Enterovirga aerilata]|uniref:SUMF1/EgtB/PvdO family nonheme iron enzyme n=1 Tax=Enterovirga aerilata TaxID=2730920 RepID=A0A849I7M3_9HYPH|nr:bifunctional serine/threonine-protein kinase/formylglycine-generating enzyme family protein [Enterovirga sp. DB1703]NNM72070.1 SUMF1/EgtB/PvdO family nonheme iron enzyme [Enterovirga sp. DB1703]